MRLIFNPFRNVTSRLTNKIVFPERLKNTIVEKWLLYWQSLMRDYKEVAVGVVKESYAHPRKALIYGAGGFAIYRMFETNPTEEVFMTELRKWNNKMLMINSDLHKPESEQYLINLEKCIIQNRLRFLSLGVCTILWEDQYDKEECTVPAQCDYTRIRFFDIPYRIIDIGAFNTFFNMRRKMINYDVNYL